MILQWRDITDSIDQGMVQTVMIGGSGHDIDPCISSEAYFDLAVIWLLKNLIFFKLFIFRFGCVFRKCIFPEGLAKELPIL